MWFKNAIIYRLTKNIDLGEIESKLKECQFTPCEPSEISRFGWTAPLETNGDLAYFADNKVLLMAKREEKILLVDVINRELNIRIAALLRTAAKIGNFANMTTLPDDWDVNSLSNYLFLISKMVKIDFWDCVQHAYEQIKDRKGKMIDGVFVKEEDLN